MITKRLSPKGRSVRVTFELPSDAAQRSVAVVGSFNDWDREAHLMKRHQKDGVWRRGISFKPGETVEFRYLVDGHDWRNESDADRHLHNDQGSENSVLEL